MTPAASAPNSYRTGPDERGHFGLFGGRFVGNNEGLAVDPGVDGWTFVGGIGGGLALVGLDQGIFIVHRTGNSHLRGL